MLRVVPTNPGAPAGFGGVIGWLVAFAHLAKTCLSRADRNLISLLGREDEFHTWLRGRNPHVGDDLAVLPAAKGKLLSGIDACLAGVHYDAATCPPEAAGRKAVNRNLSDVAAMAGTPTGLLLSITASRQATPDLPRRVYEGAAEAAEAAGCHVVGGDFSVWDGPTAIVVAVLGEADRPVPRGGAKVGQGLFVSGPLGGSILGRHLTFEPRLTMARQAAGEATNLSAMMDLSDGLSRDLPRLLDGRGAVVEADLLPIHDDARRLAATSSKSPLWHALHDGEDYELLAAADAMPAGWTRIGTVTDGGVRLREGDVDQPLQAAGFEHVLSAADDFRHEARP